MSRTLWRLLLLISLGGACELYDIFLTAYISPGLVASGLFANSTIGLFGINGVGFFVFSNFAGMLLGCMFFGHVADRFGRRTIFITSLLWYSAATAIMAFQNTAAGVDAWRFIAGIGIGLEQVTIDTLIPEFVPPGSRGRAFAFYQFIEFCIVPVVALLGWLLVPRAFLGIAGWRLVTLIGSAGAVFAWWLRRGIPESPRWLAIHGQEKEADRILCDLEKSVAGEINGSLPPALAAVPEDTCLGSFREIFHKPYRRRTLMLSVFNLMQTIAFYGFGSWVPTLLVAKGIQITTSLQYAFVIAIANPAGPLLGMLVADRMERKWQIVSAGLGIGFFMWLFAIQTSSLLVILLGVAVTLSNNWMSFTFHNYQAELFPTRVRARAVGFVYAWSRASAAFAGLLIGFFLKTGGAPAVALFIGAAMVVMTSTIGIFGPRTRNLALEQISH